METTSLEMGDRVETQPPREEGYLHYLARESRWALGWCIGLCMIGIVVTMVSPIWFVAFIPAAVMLLCGVLLLMANAIERRSDAEAHREFERAEVAVEGDIVEDHADDHEVAPEAQEIIVRQSKTGAAILCVAVLAALLIAYLAIGQGPLLRLLPVAALVVFAYMLLLMAPVWLGWFNDDIEDQTKRQERDSQEQSLETAALASRRASAQS